MDPSYWQAEARFDWPRYVQEHGGIRSIRSKPDEYLLECPDCGKPKLAVHVGRRVWRCFTCGDGGRDAASFVAKVEKIPWGHGLVKVLEGCRSGISRVDKIEEALIQPKEIDGRAFTPIPWPEGFRFLLGSEPLAQCREMVQAVMYCSERRIPEYVISEMKLGICTSGLFRGRLIFPCFDSGGRLIFYQGRAMWKPSPKELRHIKVLSPRTDDGCAGPSDCLLNLSFCADRIDVFNQRVLVVEGPVDCAHAWPDAVATWGKKISPKQMELLLRAGVKEIDLAWDPDAVSEMEKIAPILSDLFRVRIVHLPTGSDPGSLSKEEIEDFRAKAQPWGSGDRYTFLP